MLYKIANQAQFLAKILTFSSFTLVCVWPVALNVSLVYEKSFGESQSPKLRLFSEDAESSPLRLENAKDADSTPNFSLSHFKADFVDAMYHCRNKNMQLVTIEDNEKEQALLRYLNKFGIKEKDGIWTSGNDVKTERRFIWESTSRDFMYFNYEFLTHINSVVDDVNNCVSIQYSTNERGHNARDVYWKETSCWETLHFVCQKAIQ